MQQLIEAIGENFSAILSGFFVIVGTFFGWLLTLLTEKHQDRIQLAFVEEGTPNDELIERELRTKTSSSECSIRIYNVGKSACFWESLYIMRKGHSLVECYDVSGDHGAIAPNSILRVGCYVAVVEIFQGFAHFLRLLFSNVPYHKPLVIATELGENYQFRHMFLTGWNHLIETAWGPLRRERPPAIHRGRHYCGYLPR